MDLCWQSNASAFKYPVWVGHSFSSKEQASFFFLSKHLLMSWLQSPSAMILELPQIKSLTISIVRDWSDRVPEELWMEVCDIVQEAVIKTIPKKNKCKKAKWLSEEVLQIGVKRREVKGKGEKEWYTHLNGEFQTLAREEGLPQWSMQINRGKQQNRKDWRSLQEN